MFSSRSCQIGSTAKLEKAANSRTDGAAHGRTSVCSVRDLPAQHGHKGAQLVVTRSLPPRLFIYSQDFGVNFGTVIVVFAGPVSVTRHLNG